MPQHVPGEPANALSEGFDYTNPLNAGEVSRLRDTLDILTRCRVIAANEVAAADSGSSLLAIATARELDYVTKLPPFPLPGELAPLGLFDLTVFMAAWKASLDWLKQTQQITIQTPPTPENPTGLQTISVIPLDVFRRVMSGVGKQS